MIYLQPIGQVDQSVLSFLKDALTKIWTVAISEPFGVPKSIIFVENADDPF